VTGLLDSLWFNYQCKRKAPPASGASRGVCPVQEKSTSLQPINSPATMVEFASTHVCTFTEDQSNSAYVFYTGGIAGISDSPTSKADTESFNRGANEIEFNGQRVDRV
jgi:hypothetical protein